MTTPTPRRGNPQRLPARRLPTRWLPLLAYAIIALVATHPLWQHLASAVPSDIGDPLLNTWILAWDAHAWLTSPLHLFSANIFFPLPDALAYSEHLAGTACTVLPVLLLTDQPVVAYNVAFLLSFILGGWGTYLLVRRYTRHPWAAFLAGLAFAYAPYRLTAFSHLQLLTLQWLPLALICLESALRRRGWRVLAAFCLLFWLQVTTSWHLAVFAGFTVSIYLVGWLLGMNTHVGWGQRLGGLARAVLGLAVVAALTWPLVPPYLTLLSQLRQARPIELAAAFGARLSDYLAAPPFNQLFGKLTAPLAGRPLFTEENFLFIGLVAPLLALLGLLGVRRFVVATSVAPHLPGRLKSSLQTRSLIWTWTVILIGAWVLTWGPFLEIGGAKIPLPYYALSGLSPVFSLIRVPPRWMAAATLPLAVLVGYGAAALLGLLTTRSLVAATAPISGKGDKSPTTNLPRRFVVATSVASVLLAVALLAESWSVPLPLAPVGTTAELPECYHWLAAQPGDFGVLEMPIYVAPRPEYPETRRLYASTIHWKRLVNGYSGLTPARQTALDAELQGFPDEPSLQALRDLGRQGVRLLIIHSNEQGLDRGHWEGIGRPLLDRSSTTWPVHESQGNVVYEINPWGDTLVTDPQAVPDEGWRARAPRPANAHWQGGLTCLAYGLDTSYVDLYWRAEASFPHDATVFVHLLDAAGAIVAQGDGPPIGGRYSTSQWRPGEIIRDRHTLVPTVGRDPATGVQLRIGLYYPQTQERLPVIDPAGQPIGDYVLLPK